MGSGALSPEDFAQLRFISDPLCDRCGVCLAPPLRWDWKRAALIDDDNPRRPVLDLKRAGRRDGLETLSGWMRQPGCVLIDETEVLL